MSVGLSPSLPWTKGLIEGSGMNSARQHATEAHARLEPRKGPSGPLMPAMPAGPDYWPVPVQPTPAQSRSEASVGQDGRARVQAP